MRKYLEGVFFMKKKKNQQTLAEAVKTRPWVTVLRHANKPVSSVAQCDVAHHYNPKIHKGVNPYLKG